MAQSLPILVVEDDPNLREAVCDTLELAGQSVVSAPGGVEALKLLEAQPVSIVVSDACMTPMDGIALLKEIRSRFPHLPVVLMRRLLPMLTGRLKPCVQELATFCSNRLSPRRCWST